MSATCTLKSKAGDLLWDFFDLTGATNPGGCICRIRHFGFATHEPEATYSSPESNPGGSLVKQRAGLRRSEWRLYLEGPNKDGLLEGYNALDNLLRSGEGKYIERQLDGQSEPRSLLFENGWLADLIREDSGNWVELDTTDLELPLTLVHQPTWSGAELDPDVNKLSNSPLLAATGGVPYNWTVSNFGSGSPSGPRINEVDKSFEFTVNGISQGYHQQLAASAGQVWSARVEAAMLAGNRPARLFLEFRDATTLLASVSATTTSVSYVDLSVISAAAPAGTTMVRLHLLSHTSGSGAGELGFRKSQLEQASSISPWRAGRETISNDPLATTSGGQAFAGFIHGDAPTFVRVEIEPTVDEWSRIFIAALDAEAAADHVTFLNGGKHYQLENATPGTDTSVINDTSDAVPSGSNNALQTVPANNTLAVIRATVNTTALLTGRRGRMAVFARTRPTVASDWALQMKWGLRNISPADHVCDVVYALANTTYAYRYLGDIVIPADETAERLFITLHARRDSASGSLNWDQLAFVPTKHLTFADVPAGTLVTGRTLKTNPQAGEAAIFNSTDQRMSTAKMEGGVPLLLPPGPFVLHVFSQDPIAQQAKVGVRYSPQYPS